VVGIHSQLDISRVFGTRLSPDILVTSEMFTGLFIEYVLHNASLHKD